MDVARRLYWDYDSGKDLVQEVALKCWRDPKIRFNPRKGTLEGFLYRIARNTAVDMWRKNKNKIVPCPVDDVELTAMLEGLPQERDDAEFREKCREMLERGIREMYRRYPSKDGNDAFVMFSRDGASGGDCQ